MRALAMIRLVFSVLLSLSWIAAAQAADQCVKKESVCLEGPATKIIGGVEVYRECWKYQDAYDCVEEGGVDYCSPFTNAPKEWKCYQQKSECVEYFTDSKGVKTCTKYRQTWHCGNPVDPQPENTQIIDQTYTLIDQQEDRSQCTSIEQNPSCKLAQKVCTEPAETRVVNGVSVHKDCWKWREDYACTATSSNECKSYQDNPKCELKTSTCADKFPNGQCQTTQNTYSCITQAASSGTVTDCSGQQFCNGGACFDTGYEPDHDFGQTVAVAELMRQAGIYGEKDCSGDASGMNCVLFKGQPSECINKVWVGNNCCNSNNGGGYNMSNYQMISQTMTVLYDVVGSPYMFDALYSIGGSDLTSIWTSIYGSNQCGPPAATQGTSFYFVDISWANGGLDFSINYTQLYIYIAMYVITEMTTCDPQSQITSMKKGVGLCSRVGSWCSDELWLGIATGKVCLEKTVNYCCFNSKLARIIQEQGRPQLGRSFGDPKNPDCSGLTIGDIMKIDFSKVDFSEFIADIKPKLPNPDKVKENAQNQVNQGNITQQQVEQNNNRSRISPKKK